MNTKPGKREVAHRVRRGFVLSVAVLAAALLLRGGPALAQGIAGIIRPNGQRTLQGTVMSQRSNKCMEVANASDRNNANVRQWDCNGRSQQLWDFTQVGPQQWALVNQASGKVLEVFQGKTNNGANVQQFQWNGGQNQRWRIRERNPGSYELVNLNSNKCLDVKQGERRNGANIIQFACNGDANQLWRVGPVGGGLPPNPGLGGPYDRVCSQYSAGTPRQTCLQGALKGAADRRQGLNRNAGRYLGQYDVRFRDAFRKGYFAGWDNFRNNFGGQ